MTLYESLKFFIDETALHEDYPTTWDVEEFSKLRTFAERVRYADANLKKISSGSGRIVYKIDNEKVLKLAKNKKGVAQNEVEMGYGNDNYFTMLAKIFESDPDGLWAEMELARKVTAPIFKSIVGYSFQEFSKALSYEITNNRGQSKWMVEPDNMESFYESEFFTEVVDYLMNTDSPYGDMIRLSSYGVVSRDGEDTIVIIDYGLSGDVFKSYYS
jgi:hypothetical protein